MNIDKMFSGLAISGSGMSAQRARMDVVAQNIANAHTLDRGDGTPFRRKEVNFEAVLDGEQRGQVRVSSVYEDVTTPLQKVQKGKGYPGADANGDVSMPNVNPIFEMVDLLSATRAYEANLQAAKQYRDMVEQALSLGR